MKKVTMFAAIMILCSSFSAIGNTNDTISEDLERVLERNMLNSIEYVEDNDDLNLGFDPYFYLPPNFNPYQGMDFDLNDIEYIDTEEESL